MADKTVGKTKFFLVITNNVTQMNKTTNLDKIDESPKIPAGKITILLSSAARVE